MRFREPLEVAVHCKRRAGQAGWGDITQDLTEGCPQGPQSLPCPHRCNPNKTQAHGVGLNRVLVKETATGRKDRTRASQVITVFLKKASG